MAPVRKMTDVTALPSRDQAPPHDAVVGSITTLAWEDERRFPGMRRMVLLAVTPEFARRAGALLDEPVVVELRRAGEAKGDA
jgi:hypothetical protein